MYVHETNLYTWCSKIQVPCFSQFVKLWCGETPYVVFRLKGDNIINVSVLEIFKKCGLHENRGCKSNNSHTFRNV